MDLIEETTIERDGITYRVMIVPDYGAERPDYECYSTDATAAFARGDWQLTGVIVRPVILGSEVSDAEDSLWGVEYGTLPGHVSDGPDDDEPTHDPIEIGIDQIVNEYPVPDMITEVRGNLREMRGKFAALKLDDCPAYNPDENRESRRRAQCLRAAGHDGKHRDLDRREW